MKDLISIIIPVYNSEKYIEETIQTVLNQTYTNWELLLIDDCSTDKSKNKIEKYTKRDSRILYYKLQKNMGPAKARNKGIDLSNGRYICFLDSDDLWDNNKLEVQVDYMKHKKCAFSYHSYEFADEFCSPNGKKVIAKRLLKYNQALKNNIISTITVMFDMKIIKKDLIYMPDIKYVEDTATWWRILRNGYVAYGIPNVFSYYRRIPNSNSSNKFRTQKPLWFLYRKEEKLGLFYSLYCLFWKNFHAVIRRI